MMVISIISKGDINLKIRLHIHGNLGIGMDEYGKILLTG